MGFIDSYKKLDKLCRDIMNVDKGVTTYIYEMENTLNGSYYVRDWNAALSKLKHYRWIRNKISHEPGCTEQNMCELNDISWLDNFYDRIMKQTDPISLYLKETGSQRKSAYKYTQTRNTPLPLKINTQQVFRAVKPVKINVQQKPEPVKTNAQREAEPEKMSKGELASIIIGIEILFIASLILIFTLL